MRIFGLLAIVEAFLKSKNSSLPNESDEFLVNFSDIYSSQKSFSVSHLIADISTELSQIFFASHGDQIDPAVSDW